MKVNYKSIRNKKPRDALYIWFLEMFGKRDVELRDVFKFASGLNLKWFKDNFPQTHSVTTFEGCRAYRDRNGDIFEFYLNGKICRAEKFTDVQEFPSGSFLPVHNSRDINRYVVIGSVKSRSYTNDHDYLYFYDTQFATPSNIHQLSLHIKKIYWAHINCGKVFFDLPLYAHFRDDFCKNERLENLLKYGRL